MSCDLLVSLAFSSRKGVLLVLKDKKNIFGIKRMTRKYRYRQHGMRASTRFQHVLFLFINHTCLDF